MFPAPNQNTPASDQEDPRVQIEPVDFKGWRWVLSWIVGNSLASSPSLPLFLMVMVGDFLATMSLCIPYTFLPAVAVAKGIGAQDAAFLISAAGISSTVVSAIFIKGACQKKNTGFFGSFSQMSDPPLPPPLFGRPPSKKKLRVYFAF